MQQYKIIKSKIKNKIIDSISNNKSIISLTFVGSFEQATDLNFISDIDIIIIVDKLNVINYTKITQSFKKIKIKDIGLTNYNLKFNFSFGPLKLNDKNTVVFHIMIYDIIGHRKHVIESPFTCLDWEFFDAAYGKNIREIYSAQGVQINHLINSRRSLFSYLQDFENNHISYREYEIINGELIEITKKFLINERHKIEFAFHIIKFILLNLYKILNQNNSRMSVLDLILEYNKLDKIFLPHTKFLMELYNCKYNQTVSPILIYDKLKKFIETITNWIKNLNIKTVTFYRHAKTDYNDGTFLGQNRNPSILTPISIHDDNFYNTIYTSTLLRTMETAKFLKYKNLKQSKLLDEINYGKVEGMNINTLPKKYPKLVQLWASGKDPKFPNGESQKDVLLRLKTFLETNLKTNNNAVVTHNVVMRALIGNTFLIPIKDWYKINIEHIEPNNFYIYNNKIIPNLTEKQQTKYKDEIFGFKENCINKYGIFWIPNEPTQKLVTKYKNKIEKIEKTAPYLNHLTHSTIFLFNGFEKNEKNIFEMINKEISQLNIDIEDWYVFKNDEITQGDTLVLKIKKTKELLNFQKKIATKLLDLKEKNILYPNEWKGVYKKSYNKFGFPFVGSHWVPHITIASIQKNKHILNTIINEPFKINKQDLGHIGLYKVTDYAHICIYKWEIK